MFNFYSATDFEINEMRGILKPGTYQFECIEASHQVSKKSGNSMLVLQLKVWDETGKSYLVKDWLVGTKEMAFKTKKFLESIGKDELYKSGKIDPEIVLFKTGKLKTGIRKDDQGYEYPNVMAYLKPETVIKSLNNQNNDSLINQKIEEDNQNFDDLPF